MNFLHNKLERLGYSFLKVLDCVEVDEKTLNIDTKSTIRTFDWFQGVGLYGFYKLYKLTNEDKYLKILVDYYDDKISKGLPPKNINSMAPMLTLCFLNKELRNMKYDDILLEWSDYLYHNMPRTANGVFQHTTSEAKNDNQLWDDTLFMSVLFLAKAGIIYKKEEYVEDAIYQFLEHAKYLADCNTGLWYHGYDLNNHNRFGAVLWGRGNSWITVFIPEFLDIIGDYSLMPCIKKYMIELLRCQVKALEIYQSESGMWNTVLDDNTSYLETSCTAGFAYGILKSVRKGYIDTKYEEVGLKALKAVIDNINQEGIVDNVSGGTRMGECKEFYKQIPIKAEPYGQALAMLALIEGLLH